MRLLIALLALAVLAPLGLVFAVDLWRDEVATVGAPQPQATTGATTPGPAQQSARLRLARVGTFSQPIHVTAPPDDRKRLFVVEQSGRIRLLVNGKRKRRPFLDISGDTSKGGERGLLSMAFAPDYAASGKFYVNYTDRAGDTRIQEFRRSSNPNRADKSRRRELLKIDQPFPNHNGGLVLFGPDKLLYIGMGDGGSAGDPSNRAQDRDSLLGKMLRIDPRPSGGRPYTVPDSNPFVGKGGRGEIYSVGLRNPWRFSFDRKSGDLYIADVGQDMWEEINFAREGGARGANYGWSCREGKHSFDSSRSCPNPAGPVHETSHAAGNCSITGGVVVRDPGLASLRGRYVYGDFCAGRIASIKAGGGGARGTRLKVSLLSSFGEDAAGRVYVASQEGPVYRLQD